MNTNIQGWAFHKDEAELKQKCMDRYGELKHLRAVVVKTTRSDYGANEYTGRVPLDLNLSPHDIALICDYGNTCFGGLVEHDPTTGAFRCRIYTD